MAMKNSNVSEFLMDFTLLKSVRIPPNLYTEADLRALAVFVLKAERVAGPVTLSLDLTGHSRIHALNRRFRGVDRTTDVISFRETPRPALAGDIAINVAQAAVQAKKIKHSLPRELRLLWIHGILHLLDYTDYDPIPRRKMFKRQNQLLRQWELRAGKK
jgi:probable rRNA maturation factor